MTLTSACASASIIQHSVKTDYAAQTDKKIGLSSASVFRKASFQERAMDRKLKTAIQVDNTGVILRQIMTHRNLN